MDIRLQENLCGKQHDYMAPFLWLHGEEDSLIIRELERIYDSGIRSVCLESRTHEDFGREEWWSDMRLIMDFCRQKGMKVWILDDKNFPSGKANGAFYREENAHLRPWGITERHIDVSGPVTDGSAMADCWKAEAEDEIVAVLACRHVPGADTYTQVLDITGGLRDGMVYFDLPEGMWRILFLVKTRSGLDEYSTHFCDMLNPASVKVFVDEVYENHFKQLKEYFGDPLLGFFSDEPSFRNNSKNVFFTPIGLPFAHYPWRDDLLPELTGRLGPQARAMLAGLWFNIDGVTSRCRYEYMDLISRRYSRNFCSQLGCWCRDHGLEYIGHIIEDNNSHTMTGAGLAHFFRAMADQDMSGIDIVLHQLIPGLTECASAGMVCYEHMENEFFHYSLAKLGASLAHIDPKKRGRAMCEIFGAFGWAEGTRYMKYLADHMLVRGINYYVPHAFSPRPNDPDCPPNFYDSGKNALYKYFRNIMDYMNRVCHLHQGGIHVPAAALLYDAEAHWVSRNRLPLEKCGKALYDNLLDYDILPADVLENVDEQGCLNGEHYPCLIVPYYEDMPHAIVEKLLKCPLRLILAVRPGLTVEEEELKARGDIVDLQDLASFVRHEVGWDVEADYEGIFLRHYHYVRGGIHSCMFTSEDIHNPIRAQVTLSCFHGGDYILYDPMENRAFAGYSKDGRIAIELMPYNSLMIFWGDISTSGLPALKKPAYRTEVLNPLFRISRRREPETAFTHWLDTDRLFNVTGPEGDPRYSGNIRYNFTLELESGHHLLDLGRVGEAAELFANGVSAGRRLVPPYVFDLSAVEKPGINEISVIVSNHSGYHRRDEFSRYVLFEPSGLLGPVTLKTTEED